MKHNLDLVINRYSIKEIEENIIFFDDWDWVKISTYQYLTDNFIEKYSDKVDWDQISYFQYLSETFIRKHINKINFKCLIYNKNISEEIKNEINTLKEII
jgi:hypothetical protein